MDNRQKLKSKLRKKKEERLLGAASSPFEENFNAGETDIVKMMENVNKILKTNPQMVKQVSKCVSNVMGNKDLMEKLMGQLQDQTLDNKTVGEQTDASEKE